MGLPPGIGLPGFSAGGGMPISASSSATATGGRVGDFNFSPKATSPLQLAIIAGAVVLAMILMKR